MDSITQIDVSNDIALLAENNGLNHESVRLCNETAYTLQWPDNKNEYWKYTKLNAIKKLNLVKASTSVKPNKTDAFEYSNGQLVGTQNSDSVDFYYASGLEKLPSFKNNFGRLSPWKNDVFAASNLLNSKNTLGLVVQKNKQEKNLLINIESSENNLAESPRLFIVCETSSELQMQINLSGIGKDSLRNLAIEAFVADNAKLEINIVQEENTEAYTIVQSDFEIKSNAQAKINHFNIDTHWTRANTNLYIDGQNADAQVNGIYLPNNNQFIDHHTLIHHALPHCTSHELFKGIIANNSKAVFNGKVLVSKDAQKTDAFQKNNNVIIDESSGINAKPELEIYADDVKCSHGCTIGQLDEEAVYYLRARGISKNKARAMVLNAFCEEALILISNETLRESVSNKVHTRLSQMH